MQFLPVNFNYFYPLAAVQKNTRVYYIKKGLSYQEKELIKKKWVNFLNRENRRHR